MLKQLYARGLSGLPDVSFDFVPGLNVITGPIGSGKTMRTRDILFLLLAGRMPSKRTNDCLGKKSQMGVTLDNDLQTMSILRSGASVRLLEDQTVSGSGPIKERVAMMTGIPATDLAELCYCSGMKLQANMQLSSSFLSTMRAAIGSSTSRFSDLVSSEVSSVRGRLAVEAQRSLAVPVDLEDLRMQVAKADEARAAAEAELAAAGESEAVCRAVLSARLASDVEEQIRDLEKILKPVLALSEKEVCRLVDEASLYGMAGQIASEIEAYIGSGRMLEASPTLARLLEQAGRYAEAVKAGAPIKELRGLLDEYRGLAVAPVVSRSDKDKAETYLRYVDDLRNAAGAAADACRNLMAALTLAERAEAGRTAGAEETDRLSSYLARLELLQDCVLPSGMQSVEKQLVETVSSGVLGAATDYLCLCGMHAEMQYDTTVGITLVRSDGPVKAQELSEGETMIAALCLRLAIAHTLKPIPFLILDDITGSLGIRAAAVTDMLRVFAHEHSLPIVLNTQEIRVTGDVFYRLEKI